MGSSLGLFAAVWGVACLLAGAVVTDILLGVPPGRPGDAPRDRNGSASGQIARV